MRFFTNQKVSIMKYMTQSREVNAIQYTGDNMEEISNWLFPGWNSRYEDPYLIISFSGSRKLKTLSPIKKGSWIVSHAGKYYVYNDQEFKNNFFVSYPEPTGGPFEKFLQDECGGYPLRTILDNLMDDQIEEAIEEYVQERIKHSKL